MRTKQSLLQSQAQQRRWASSGIRTRPSALKRRGGLAVRIKAHNLEPVARFCVDVDRGVEAVAAALRASDRNRHARTLRRRVPPTAAWGPSRVAVEPELKSLRKLGRGRVDAELPPAGPEFDDVPVRGVADLHLSEGRWRSTR